MYLHAFDRLHESTLRTRKLTPRKTSDTVVYMGKGQLARLPSSSVLVRGWVAPSAESIKSGSPQKTRRNEDTLIQYRPGMYHGRMRLEEELEDVHSGTTSNFIMFTLAKRFLTRVLEQYHERYESYSRLKTTSASQAECRRRLVQDQ